MLPGRASREQMSCPQRGVSCQHHQRAAALPAEKEKGVGNITLFPQIKHLKGKLHMQNFPAVSVKGEIQNYFYVTRTPHASALPNAKCLSSMLGRLCCGSLLKATCFHLCEYQSRIPSGSWQEIAVDCNLELRAPSLAFSPSSGSPQGFCVLQKKNPQSSRPL